MKIGAMVGTGLLGLMLLGGPALMPVHAQESPEIVKQHIYSETADPRQDIAAALKQARRQHKHVLLTFGGDWCPDCQMLNLYLHDPVNQPIVDKNYVVVHVWIGHMDLNLDLAQEYGVPIKKGVPAVSVLDAHGKVLAAQSAGEFSNMRSMPSSAVTDFLNRWKA